MNTTTSIALITKYSTEGFDKVYKHDAISSVLSKSSEFLKFTGAKTVKVAKIAMGGLSDYYRNNNGDSRVPYGPGNEEAPEDYVNPDAPYFGVGYRGTAASTTWEERTIRMDRAAKIIIERFDDEESGGLMVGNLLSEFNRTKVVPEVDAFCFSEIYYNAGKKVSGKKKISIHGADVDAPLAALGEAFTYLGKLEVPEDNQIVFMSYDYINALRNSQETTKFLEQGDFEKNVSFQLTSYEGRRIVLVPPARFQTEFVFTDNGYRLAKAGDTIKIGADTRTAAGSKDIDFIVMALDAATHVVKFQKTQILSGNEALIASNVDGFVMYARIYHDLFVFDNKRPAIYAHTDWFTTSDANRTSANAKVDVSGAGPIDEIVANVTVANGKAKSIVVLPGDIYATIVEATAANVTVGTTRLGASAGTGVIAFADVKVVREGDAYTAAENKKLYVVDAKGVFVKECLVNGAAQ